MNKLFAALAVGAVALLALWSSLDLFSLMGQRPGRDPYGVEQHLQRHAGLTPPARTKALGFASSEKDRARSVLLFMSRYALAPVLVVDSETLLPRIRAERAGVAIEDRAQ